MAIQDELAKLSTEIESAKKQVATLEGRKAEVMDRLKKDFECVSVEEAETLLDTLSADVVKMDVTIKAEFEALKKKFSW
jgi:predicted transcriptional regulator